MRNNREPLKPTPSSPSRPWYKPILDLLIFGLVIVIGIYLLAYGAGLFVMILHLIAQAISFLAGLILIIIGVIGLVTCLSLK